MNQGFLDGYFEKCAELGVSETPANALLGNMLFGGFTGATTGELRSALTQLNAKPRMPVDNKDLVFSGMGGGLGGIAGGALGTYLDNIVHPENRLLAALALRVPQIAGGMIGSIGGSALKQQLYPKQTATRPLTLESTIAGSPAGSALNFGKVLTGKV